MPKEKVKIIPGQRFGKLTIVSDSGLRKNGYTVWNCRCDCGKELQLSRRTLLHSAVSDCGCTTLPARRRDITGQRFGKLIAEYSTEQVAKDGSYLWHCKCDCGGEVDAPLHQLTAGYRKSCGCMSNPPRKEWIGQRFGRLTVVAYVGKERGSHHWKCLCDCGNELIANQSNLNNGHTQSCGCIRAELPVKNLKIIDGTSVTILERRRGRIMASNTSGCTGVYLQKRTGKWAAQITFKGKTYFLGTYENKADAIRARKRSEEMHLDFLDWYHREYESSPDRVAENN